MTALELAQAGVVFSRAHGLIRVQAPKGRADLVAVLRAEVARRVPELRFDELPRPRADVGACDICLDPLERGRGGMCALCVAARYKALTALGRIAA